MPSPPNGIGPRAPKLPSVKPQVAGARPIQPPPPPYLPQAIQAKPAHLPAVGPYRPTVVQMTPAEWGASATVHNILSLESGGFLGIGSKWGPIQEQTRQYGLLREDDIEARKRVLLQLRTVIGLWERNQETANVRNKELVSQKRDALTA